MAPTVPEKVSVTYFNIRGLGEDIRLVLVDNGIKFEDNRTFVWVELKEQLQPMFGQLPVLQWGDKQICQSKAILRFLGRQLNLLGSTDDQVLLLDQIMEGFADVRSRYISTVYAADGLDRKATFINNLKNKDLKYLEAVTKEHAKPFFGGESPAIVDYYALETLSVVSDWQTDVLEDFPALAALLKALRARPNIAAYFENGRPKLTNGSSAVFGGK